MPMDIVYSMYKLNEINIRPKIRDFGEFYNQKVHRFSIERNIRKVNIAIKLCKNILQVCCDYRLVFFMTILLKKISVAFKWYYIIIVFKDFVNTNVTNQIVFVDIT